MKDEAVAAAIQNVNAGALIAQSMKHRQPTGKPAVASYVLPGGMNMGGEYGDLLGKA